MVQQQSLYCNENEQKDQQVYWMSWYITEKSDNSPCLPPFDLVVQHLEKDEYPFKDPLTGAVQKRISPEKPKYYHPSPSCILQRHPYFNASMLRLQEGLNIDSVHEEYLATVFSINM